MQIATTRARPDVADATAPRYLRFTMSARINPAVLRRRKRDAVPRFGLANFARFGAKIWRVSARQMTNVQPQMNHFMFENFAQCRRAVARSHAADFVAGAALKSVN